MSINCISSIHNVKCCLLDVLCCCNFANSMYEYLIYHHWQSWFRCVFLVSSLKKTIKQNSSFKYIITCEPTPYYCNVLDTSHTISIFRNLCMHRPPPILIGFIYYTKDKLKNLKKDTQFYFLGKYLNQTYSSPPSITLCNPPTITQY